MSDKKSENLQDAFLDSLIEHRITTAIYLKSGIKLHGRISSYDHYTISLEENTTQLIFKHAIATIVPSSNE